MVPTNSEERGARVSRAPSGRRQRLPQMAGDFCNVTALASSGRRSSTGVTLASYGQRRLPGRRSPTSATTSTALKAEVMLAKYARAVEIMKALPAYDTRSWTWWWNTHWIKGYPAFLWDLSQKRKKEAIDSLPPEYRAAAEAVWNGCQAHAYDPSDPEHFQQWFFLPWHRLDAETVRGGHSRGAAR